MSNRIRIKKDAANVIFIDTSDVTGVKFHEQMPESWDAAMLNSGEPCPTKVMSVFSSEGEMVKLGLDEWKINPVEFIKELRYAGVRLAHYPERIAVKRGVFRQEDAYINPEAVVFAAASEVTQGGYLLSTISVKGFDYRETSNNNSPKEWAKFLDAVRAVKPFIEYDKPEEAFSPLGWSPYDEKTRPATFYIDPKSVTYIKDIKEIENKNRRFRGRIDVSFAQAAEVSIFVKDIKASDILNNIPAVNFADKSKLSEAFMEAQRCANEFNRETRLKFSNELAAARDAAQGKPSSVSRSVVAPK